MPMYFYLQNVDTGLVLDVRKSDISAGTPIIMYKYYGTSNQLWYYENKMIYSKLNGMVLDVNISNELIIYPAHGRINQLWYFEGEFIRSGNGNHLDVAEGKRCAGAKLITFKKNYGGNQKFRVVPI